MRILAAVFVAGLLAAAIPVIAAQGDCLKDGGATAGFSFGACGEVQGGDNCGPYPVGALYESTVATNPGDASQLGCGTWSAFGAGRVLVGIDAGQTEFDTNGETGGAKTHTLTESEMPSHAHTVTDPGHVHVENSNSATTGGLRGWGAADTSTNTSTATGYSTASATTGVSVNDAGGDGAHNNLQPYIVVYMWKRTA